LKPINLKVTDSKLAMLQLHGSRFNETDSRPMSNSDILKKAASMTLEQASPESIKSNLTTKQKLNKPKG